MTNNPKCDSCDKRGLPLLLVRDAVAPHGHGAPLSNELPIELAPGAAHYTKRVLRSGYLNVYDEARKRWEAYFVTPEGYLYKYLHTTNTTPVLPEKAFKCNDNAHREPARCLTVPDPKRATKVWIGFSDVLWTPAVRKANENASYRERHMVRIEVQALLSGSTQPQTRPIAQVSAVVAEYAMEAAKGAAAFNWSESPFQARRPYVKDLIQKCEELYPGKAYIVTVPDPAGIAQELALLMKHNLALFAAKPEYARNLAASAAISEIEVAVKARAEIDELDAAEMMANQQISDNPLGHWLSETTRQSTKELRNVTPAQADRAAANAWQRYARKFNNTERQAWEKSYNQALLKFDQKNIVPLARNHVTWMKSTQLANYFQCNYDGAHSEAGLVYTEVMTRCIASTQDKTACSKLYEEWLAGKTDPNNLLLRAMIFNQNAVAEKIGNSTGVNISLRQIPWDNIFSIYSSSMEKVSKGSLDRAAHFVAEFAGPLARVLGKIADGTPGFRAAVIATGLIAGHPVRVFTVTGSKKKFREHVVRQLIRASGKRLSENAMRRAVSNELRRLQIRGVPIEGSAQHTWITLSDEIIIKQAALVDGPHHTERLASSLMQAERLNELNLERWRSVINSNVRFGLIAGILQYISLTKLMSDQESALSNESKDARYRMIAGAFALSATLADVIGSALEARATQALRYGAGMRFLGALLSTGGKVLGVAAGLFVAGLDLRKAFNEYQEGADGLVVAGYAGSALIGISLTVALLSVVALKAAAIPIIGLLVVLIIGIGILIEYIKDNPIQDWLERCPWGNLVNQRYPDMITEQNQLKLAFG